MSNSPASPQEVAASMGLRLIQCAEGLWNVDHCTCLVSLSNWGNEWRVSRKWRRWRTIYRGPSLKTALRKAAEWKTR